MYFFIPGKSSSCISLVYLKVFSFGKPLFSNKMSRLSFDCGWSDSVGLGWFVRLLRWTVAHVCITPELHRAVISSFVKRAPLLFKLWSKFREVGGGHLVSSGFQSSLLDIGDKSSPALAQTVSKYVMFDYYF